MKRGAVAVATLAAVLAVPGVASAHRYKVWAGDPGRQPSGVPGGTALNAFLPAKVTVRKGDRITWSNVSFHTVSIVGKGVDPASLALVAPDPAGGTYQGINTPSGSPFYFNGLPKFVYNPAVFAPAGSTNVKDSKTHSSGAFAPSSNAPAKYTLKFSRPGTYKVVCLIHPGMQQTVTVRKTGKGKVDSARKVRKAIAKQAKRLYKAAGAASRKPVPANTVFAGVQSKQATLLAFLPNKLTVPRGTPVTFVNQSPSEVHNMAFGPADYIQQEQAATDLLPRPGSSENQFAPFFIYGSEPGGAPGAPPAYTYTGANQGNGFLWTMLNDDQSAGPLPQSETITFTQPGTYHYFCVIHGPSMSGDIVVQ